MTETFLRLTTFLVFIQFLNVVTSCVLGVRGFR
jgi:hypothetical protein